MDEQTNSGGRADAGNSSDSGRIAGDVPFHFALQASFVEAEEREVATVFEESASHGESGIALFVSGVEFVRFGQADGVDVGFDGGSALEAPAIVGNGLDEVGFHGALRGE